MTTAVPIALFHHEWKNYYLTSTKNNNLQKLQIMKIIAKESHAPLRYMLAISSFLFLQESKNNKKANPKQTSESLIPRTEMKIFEWNVTFPPCCTAD